MMYVKPRRLYQNVNGFISPILYDAIAAYGKPVTLNPNFSIANRRGTWEGSPFNEVTTIPPSSTIPYDLAALEPAKPINKYEALKALFDAVCDSIAISWRPDKFHLIFHSAGFDSRIISSAIKKLWLDQRINLDSGILFLSNEWEAEQFRSIMEIQGWPKHWYAVYQQGEPEDHFYPSLHFDTFWHTTNAPIPICGNLWYYLPVWAEGVGLLPESNVQAYCGMWANETWNAFRIGKQHWIRRYGGQYYYNVNAVFRHYIETENPLSDLNVLKIVWAVEGNVDGDDLREAVANYADPKIAHIPNPHLDDRGHAISKQLRDYCEEEYAKSWYGKRVRHRWECPATSEFSNEWGWYGLASLCEELIRNDIGVTVGRDSRPRRPDRRPKGKAR